MLLKNQAPTAPMRARRPLFALGAAALAVPLMLSSTAAYAQSNVPSADSVAAITSDTLLVDFQNEYLQAVDTDNIWQNDVKLSHEIGPRLRGTPAELEAVNWVAGVFESYGLDVTIEEFRVTAQRFADVVPSRYTDEYASWQFRPAGNSPLTGVDAPITGELVDIGNTTTGLADRTDLVGKIVLADWNSTTSTRTSILTDVKAAGAIAVVFAVVTGSESLPNPGNLPAAVSDMIVVGAATNQGLRMRTLLADGPLSLTITTDIGTDTSHNAIGVLPAANGDANAPIIYLGAHIDSVLGSPGASDNGSGVSILIEIARIMSEYSYDAEIRFGVWGAEESGFQGSNYHVKTVMSAEEQARTLGAWNMDMAGTNYEGNPGQPFGFWALTADTSRLPLEPWESPVLDFSNDVSLIAGAGDLPIGTVSRSDHQPFHDVGIKAAVFSWMFWAGGTNIILEPAYHQTTDTLEFVSAERMGHAARILGGGAFRAALNMIDVTVTDASDAPVAGVQVAMTCDGDSGWRDFGVTQADGTVANVVPHTSCEFVALADNGDRGALAPTAFDSDDSVAIELVADTAPAVSIVSSPAVGASGWYQVDPVMFTLGAEDNFDETELIEFSFDGIDWTAYTEPIAVTGQGQHTLFVRATDAFDHVSDVVSYPLQIDSVNPAVSAVKGDDRGSITGTVSDATSGVAVVQYRIGTGGWIEIEDATRSNDGTLVNFALQLKLGADAANVQVRALDVAGNVSSTFSTTFAALPGAQGGLASTGASSGMTNGGIALAALLLVGAGGFVGLRQLRLREITGDDA